MAIIEDSFANPLQLAADYDDPELESYAEARVTAALPDDFSVYTFLERLPVDPRAVARRHLDAKPIVRRPLIGLIRPDNKYSSLEILVRDGDSSQGTPVEIFNSSYRQGRATITTNYVVQRVDEAISEAVQIVETFGDWYLADVGEKPRILQVQGVLFEAENFPWASEWRMNYDKYLRARQCILRQAQAFLTIDDMMYYGYIIDTSMTRQAQASWQMVPFSFSMVLRGAVDVSPAKLFPEIEDPYSGEVRNEDVRFVDGLRIPATVSFEATDFTNAVDVPPGDDALNAIKQQALELYNEPLDLRLAQSLEIIQGQIDGQIEITEPVLEFRGDIEPAILENNIDRLTAVARKINKDMGFDFFDLQGLRVGYQQNVRAQLDNLGLYDPYGPANFGLPTEFQDEVAARRRRQQEEVLDEMRDFFDDARSSGTREAIRERGEAIRGALGFL